MAELNHRELTEVAEPGLGRNLERLDQDLDIMERHAGKLADVESGIQQSMRRWDREYKDARLHSVPKPKKHVR